MTLWPIAGLAALSILCGCTGLTAGSSAPPTLTKQAREQPALLHERMAACLHADRAPEECHGEMTRNSRGIEGAEEIKGMQGCQESMKGCACDGMKPANHQH